MQPVWALGFSDLQDTAAWMECPDYSNPPTVERFQAPRAAASLKKPRRREAETQLCKRGTRWKSVEMCTRSEEINQTILRQKLQDVKDFFLSSLPVFVLLIQFEVSYSFWILRSSERKGGPDVTSGLSRCSRLWTRFLRGSGEDPVATSGDLGSEVR